MLIKELEEYKKRKREFEEWIDRFGRALVKALSPVIPDIEFYVGPEEWVCLVSRSRENPGVLGESGGYDLGNWLWRRGYEIDTPFGVFVTREELKKIVEILGIPESQS